MMPTTPFSSVKGPVSSPMEEYQVSLDTTIEATLQDKYTWNRETYRRDVRVAEAI